MKEWLKQGLWAGIVSCSMVAHADLSWKGFLTAAGSVSNVRFLETGIAPLYAENIEKQISFEPNSVLGLQFKKRFDEVFSAKGRLVAIGREDWEVKATRAYIRYSPAEKWHWRMGRIPVDYLIHSDDYFESFQYPWIALPESLYDMVPFHHIDGIDGGAKYKILQYPFKLRIAYGGLNEHTTTPVTDIDIKYKLRQVGHVRAVFGKDIFRVYTSYMVGRLTWGINAANEIVNQSINSYISNDQLGRDYLNYLTVKNEHLSYQSVGYAFSWKKILSYAEYLRRQSSAAVIPNLNAWYIMLGVHHQGLLPFFTFTRQRITDNQTRRFSGAANVSNMQTKGQTLDKEVQAIAEGSDGPASGDQTVYTFGVRWNIIKNLSVKAQFDHVHPDRGSSGLFNLHPHKSVHIYRIAADTYFSS